MILNPEQNLFPAIPVATSFWVEGTSSMIQKVLDQQMIETVDASGAIQIVASNKSLTSGDERLCLTIENGTSPSKPVVIKAEDCGLNKMVLCTLEIPEAPEVIIPPKFPCISTDSVTKSKRSIDESELNKGRNEKKGEKEIDDKYVKEHKNEGVTQKGVTRKFIPIIFYKRCRS